MLKRQRFMRRVLSTTLIWFVAGLSVSWAEEATIAVASNFATPAQALAQAFEQQTGHKLQLALGSTGKFYAQIQHGAPFHALLSADDDTPARLERMGAGVPGSRFTYAIGRLVLWSAKPGVVDAQGGVLRQGGFRRLAMANPKLAPYGAAAVEALNKLGLWSAWKGKLVMGENIAQTHQFVASGNAELGFVAAAQVMLDGQLQSGSGWLVPAPLHIPIRQDAILLQKGKGHAAAEAWLRYLQTEPAKALIRRYGYETSH